MAVLLVLLAMFSTISYGMGYFYTGSPSIPRGDYGMGIAYYNDAITIFGGFDNEYQYQQYNLTTNEWNDYIYFLAPGRIYSYSGNPTARIGQYVYGIDYDGDTLNKIDLLTMTDTPDFATINDQGQYSCIASNPNDTIELLFIVGGQNGGYFQIFNLTSLTFAFGSNTIDTRLAFTCQVHPSTNRLYAIGGINIDTYESVYVGIDSTDLTNESWIKPSNKLLHETQSATSVVYGDDIFIIGGYDFSVSTKTNNGFTLYDTIQILNVNTGIVTQADSTLVNAVYQSAAIVVDSTIYVFGGVPAPYSGGTREKSDVWQYCDILGTKDPTSDPTETPSAAPTEITMTPTSVPTSNPTETTLNPSADPTMQPTTNAPTIVPTTATPTTVNPTTARPTSSSPTTSSPTSSSPTSSSPTSSSPTSSSPTTMNPTTMNPTTGSPVTSAPSTMNPSTMNPTTSNPTTASPVTPQPTSTMPTTSDPTTSHPTTSAPTNNGTDEPTTASPVTAKPTSQSPTTMPTYEPTLEPTTVYPTTISPTSDIVDFNVTVENPSRAGRAIAFFVIQIPLLILVFF